MHETSPDSGHVRLKSNKLLTLRLDRHLTQQYVADSLGVDASTLGRWEKNEDKISIGKLRQLAEFYHVGIEWLLSPEPLVLHMTDNKVESGANGAYNTVNVVPKELLEQLTAQYSKHIEALHNLTNRLLDLLSERSGKSSQ